VSGKLGRTSCPVLARTAVLYCIAVAAWSGGPQGKKNQ
jgi:hypothetical protein